MNVLSIGSDRSIANPNSESARRQIAYGARLGELDIIVFSRRNQKLSMQTLGVGVRVYPTNSRSRLFYLWDAFRIVRRLPKPDVVSVQDPFESGLAGLFIARRLGVPLHVQVHTDFLSRPYAQHSALNRLRRNIATFVIPRASRIRVVSARIKAGIEKYYAPKAPITVLPIFVDVDRFRNASAGELADKFSRFEKKILVVSRLEKEKNVALAIRAFNEVAPQNACLIVVGDGRERQYLENLGGKNIFFEGTQDVASYYALADLVLVPSEYEGYGRIIIEALAAGKPVLSTDVGIAREAGAIIASPETFPTALRLWFEEGPRTGKLAHYPYRDFESYAAAYSADISACVKA